MMDRKSCNPSTLTDLHFKRVHNAVADRSVAICKCSSFPSSPNLLVSKFPDKIQHVWRFTENSSMIESREKPCKCVIVSGPW